MKRFLLNQKISMRRSPKLMSLLFGRRTAGKSRLNRKIASLLSGLASDRRILLGVCGCAAAAVMLVLALLFAFRPAAKPEPQETAALPAAESGTADAASDPTGSGQPMMNREQEIVHIVQSGQTFSEIAYIYKISVEKLAAYNGITDVNRLAEGSRIRIPTLLVEKSLTVPPQTAPKKTAVAAKTPRKYKRVGTIEIQSEQQFDGTSVTAHFTAAYPEDLNLVKFEWNLGNGSRSFREETFWTYEEPGTYTVNLKAVDSNGADYVAEKLFVDVPHPATTQDNRQHFLTLESMDRTITVNGSVIQFIQTDGRSAPPMELIGTDGAASVYRPTRSGYFGFDVNDDGTIRRFYVFVSPVESRHSDSTDINWYRTQFNTGTQSNCGPTTTASAISWATGTYVAVSAIRQELGWSGNGGVNFEDIMKEMDRHRVQSSLVHVSSVQDIFDIIDRGNIAIFLYNSGGPQFTKGRPGEDLFGKYYYDEVGHYSIIKGYSLDKKYFVVYDPIPSDWVSNGFRYSDGISMIGRNRYYGARETFASLSRFDVIEISR